MANEKLTANQARFIDEYIVCLNGTEAARRAKYEGDDRTLAVTASRLLRNAKVLREIEKRLDHFTMSANEVLIQLTDIARKNLTDVMSPQGRIDAVEARNRGKSHLVKRVKEKVVTFTDADGNDHESIETEVEMYDRQSALNTLAKFYGDNNFLISHFRQ